MANSNPQAVRFVNLRARPVCDRLSQSYHFVNSVLKQIEAEGIDKLFADDQEKIDDGSSTDGRTPVTNEDVKAMLGVLTTFQQFMDGSPEMRDLILRFSVNPFQNT